MPPRRSLILLSWVWTIYLCAPWVVGAQQIEPSAPLKALDVQPCAARSQAGSIRPELGDDNKPHSRIGMMPARYSQLLRSLAGYKMTGVPLLASQGKTIAPVASDDLGLYYVVPLEARALRLSLSESIDLFFLAVLLLSALSGTIGFWLLARNLLGRIVAIAGLFALLLISCWIGDVYIVQSCVIIGVVPWGLYLVRRTENRCVLLIFLFLSGMAVGVANAIRSHAGTAVAIFLALLVGLRIALGWKPKVALISALLVGVLLPQIYLSRVVSYRDAYLKEQGITVAGGRQHPFWHSVYIGFGFLSNPYVPGYRDEVAAEKVCSIAPETSYLSARYEEILREQVWQLIRRHPIFSLTTAFAKLGVVLLFFLVSANVGLLAAWLYPKGWELEFALWAAIAFESLFGVLVIPNVPYLLGLIAFSGLYGIISIQHAIEVGAQTHFAVPNGLRSQGTPA
jgi:hypothetical protein